MYYILYLSSLCRRRRWNDPHYETVQVPGGYICLVRVNGREYHSEPNRVFETDVLAQENAALNAYLICRNISVNESIYPSGPIAVPSSAPALPAQGSIAATAYSTQPQHMATGQTAVQAGMLMHGGYSQGLHTSLLVPSHGM